MRSTTPNRRLGLNAIVCSLLALTLLGATSRYLAHFHVPRAAAPHAAQLDISADHAAPGHCTLCLQFDRLPAPPVPAAEPVARFFAATAVEPAVPGRPTLDASRLWPPSRAPPSLTC